MQPFRDRYPYELRYFYVPRGAWSGHRNYESLAQAADDYVKFMASRDVAAVQIRHLGDLLWHDDKVGGEIGLHLAAAEYHSRQFEAEVNAALKVQP